MWEGREMERVIGKRRRMEATRRSAFGETKTAFLPTDGTPPDGRDWDFYF